MSASTARITVTSPDMSVLGLSVLYDISVGIPVIAITNHSTVTNPGQLIWWYVITTPSGTPIHTGSVDTPDIVDVAWTTIVVPDTWPTPFGPPPPYGQIEFSNSVPYVLTLYVKDSADNIFSIPVPTLISRPSGNDNNSRGNFGGAVVSSSTDCTLATIKGQDSTIVTYQGAPGEFISNAWRLIYPQNDVYTTVPPASATNTPTVIFPVYQTGPGYEIQFGSKYLYDQGNGGAVQIQYKFGEVFSVWCGVDLCALNCAIMNLYNQSLNTCSQIEDVTLKNTLNQISLLYGQLLSALIQPFCGTDVPALIDKIKKLGKFDCSCDCPTGLVPGSGNVLSTGDSIQVPIWIRDNDVPPAACPNSFYPAKVYKPDGVTFIAMAYQVEDLVAIINSTAEWIAYGFWFPAGNCKAGLFPLQTGAIVPPIRVDIAQDIVSVSGRQYYLCNPTSTCGSGAIVPQSFPFGVATVDFGAGPVSLTGPITDIDDYITKLNAAAGKPVAVTFSKTTGVYPLYIMITNINSAVYDTRIILTACGAVTGAPDLQIVTTNGNVTDQDIISGSVAALAMRSVMNDGGFQTGDGVTTTGGIYNAGSFWKEVMTRDNFQLSSYPGPLTANRDWQHQDKDDFYAGLTDITSQTLFVQVLPVTYTNGAPTPPATSLLNSGRGSIVIPANFIENGSQFRITGTGTYGAQSSGVTNIITFAFYFRDGATLNGYCSGDFGVTQISVGHISFEIFMTYNGSNLSCFGKIMGATNVTGNTGPMNVAILTAAPTPLNSTHQQTLEITGQWSDGPSTGGTCTLTMGQITMEFLKPQ